MSTDTLQHAERSAPELLTHIPRRPVPYLESIARAIRDLIGSNSAPKRTYWLSDAYGGPSASDPFSQQDLDVLLSGDFSSRPTEAVHREHDIWGQEDVTAHILRLVLQQHDELAQRKDLSSRTRNRALHLGTGVFINSAPRINRENGRPFWVATARGGNVRIVATPVEALSAVKDEIETLHYLPNPRKGDPDNGLYDWTQQFRSKLTPRLLDPDHRLDLVEADPLEHIPDARRDWHVSYVDRYGNVITHVGDTEAQWAEIERIANGLSDSRGAIRLLVTQRGEETFASAPARLAVSLGSAEPGALSVYRNGGIDVVRKFRSGESREELASHSAYRQLQNVRIGSALSPLPANDVCDDTDRAELRV